MKPRILIVSTLDTKGRETLYLKERVEAHGLEALLMDLSMGGPSIVPAQITPRMVAGAAGTTLEEMRSFQDRARLTNQTIAGACRIARKLYQEGRIHAVLGLGGSTGSLMATEVMRALPFGMPKLMISSTAALPGLSTRYIGTGDIALFHTVVEISGLSDPLKNVLDRAAGAVAGMVGEEVTPAKTDRGRAIAMTMLGPCEQCARRVREALEKEGYQVIGFSAAGIGDRAMDTMISQGFFQGVVDLAPGGVGENLYGFTRDAGPDRLDAAGKAGLPQIISLCGVNHITPAKSRYSPEHHKRRKYDLDRYRTWLRMSPQELAEVAGLFVQRLNRAKGPVRVVVPLKGWSSVDAPGNPTYDPEEDRVFVEVLQKGLKSGIEVREVDANMEEPAFAEAFIQEAISLFGAALRQGARGGKA